MLVGDIRTFQAGRLENCQRTEKSNRPFDVVQQSHSRTRLRFDCAAKKFVIVVRPGQSHLLLSNRLGKNEPQEKRIHRDEDNSNIEDGKCLACCAYKKASKSWADGYPDEQKTNAERKYARP